LAEIRNPGFLKYFLWNENFGRYLKNDYGDVYGSGHRQPFGAAWGMMILALFPWSFLAFALLWFSRAKWLSKSTLLRLLRDPIMLFAVGWTFCCPVLLLGARQYTGTYLFPSLPGFAFLGAALWHRRETSRWIPESTLTSSLRVTGLVTAITGCIFSLASIFFSAPPAIACTAAIVCVASGLYTKRSPTTVAALSSASIATLIAFGALSFTYNNYISENRSSRRVLELANSLIEADKPLRVGFANYFPFSAKFYAPLLGRQTVQVKNLEQNPTPDSELDFLILRKRSLNSVIADHPHAQEVGQVGQWRILRP
jgi:ABC-type multidrug transport system fused ATPase/permease subunit